MALSRGVIKSTAVKSARDGPDLLRGALFPAVLHGGGFDGAPAEDDEDDEDVRAARTWGVRYAARNGVEMVNTLTVYPLLLSSLSFATPFALSFLTFLSFSRAHFLEHCYVHPPVTRVRWRRRLRPPSRSSIPRGSVRFTPIGSATFHCDTR